MVDDDRQVLVVGGGLPGLAVGAALRRAGYDPVVLTEPDRTPPSELATLHPTGRSLRDRFATGTGDAAGSGSVERAVNETGGDGADRRHCPVVMTAEAVRAWLAATVPEDACRTDALRDVEREGDVLRVRFASGVREWFDLVVAADGPASTVRATRDGSLGAVDAAQVETRLAAGLDAAAGRGTWTGDALVETLPHPDDGALVRVTTDRIPRSESPSAYLRRVVDALDGLEAGGSADAIARTVTQVDDGGEWADGRIAYCGAAALPQAPATGLRTTLALADAKVLADELMAGPSSVAAAVAAYGRRRRRHVERLRESVGDRPDGSGPDPLGSIRRDRSVSAGRCDALADVGAL
ncbi:MAG: hypothetical protein V5A28_15420 [Haloarculaceae archaeon]